MSKSRLTFAMMRSSFISLRRTVTGQTILSLAAVIVFFATHTEAFSQTWTGLGSDNKFSTAGNWSPVGVPANDGTANLTFAGSMRLTPNVDIPWSVKSITFGATAGSFTIGGSTLSIGDGGITDNRASLTEKISSPISMAAAQTWSTIAGVPNLSIGASGSSIINNGNSLTIAGSGQITPQSAISGTGGVTLNGGFLDMFQSGHTFTGPVNLNGGHYRVRVASDFGSANGVLDIDGAIVDCLSSKIDVGRSVSIANGGATIRGSGQGTGLNFNGDITGPGALTVDQSAWVTLAATNSYSGGTKLNFNSVLFCSTSTIQGNVSLLDGALVFMQGFDGSYAGNITGTTAGSGVEFFGNGVVSLGGTNTYSAITLIGGTHSYQGPIVTQPGFLRLFNSAALSPNSVISMSSKSTLDLNNFDASSANLDGDGRVSLGTGTYSVGSDNGSHAFVGTIDGSGGLVKVGSGTLTLSGALTYSGATFISAGTFALSTTGHSNLVSSSTISIASGATLDVSQVTGTGGFGLANGQVLKGNGTVSGSLTATAGSHIDPGSSVGTLTATALVLAPNSILDIEFNATPANDFIKVTDSNGLTINGGILNLLQEGSSNPFDTLGTYHLLNYAGTPQGAGVSSMSILNPQSGRSYTISNNTSLHDIDLTIAVAVPEPTTLLLLAIGGLALGRIVIAKQQVRLGKGNG